MKTPMDHYLKLNPASAVGFVARVESAMGAKLSLRRNSLSYSAEGKVSEAVDTAAVSSRSRTSMAYAGLRRQATRYMLNGDVERYMRILHEMLTIRTLSRMAVS